MTTLAVRRSRSGPQAQRNSTDVIVVQPPAPASAAFPARRERFSFGRAAMHRTSGPVGIDLDNAEWEKKVMNSWPKKCTFVVREILQTERAYIASLEEVILGYMMPLHGYLLALGEGPNFIHTVFGNINKLRQLHEELLAKLHTACGDPHEFADIFIETDFTHYRDYCIRYTDANLFLQKSMNENEKLKLFLSQCQHDLDHPLPLHSHLIKPVQRILKYHLMLHEMLKYIDKEDVIYPDVKEAQDKMRKVAGEINTSFQKERNELQVATPTTIARKRSKEIKSLQRSRSEKRRPTFPEEPCQLQRSMEFEDSLSLLRGNRSTLRQTAAKTMSSGNRQHRPALTHLIGLFETSKPAQGTSSLWSTPAVIAPSPPPKPASTHPTPNQSPPPSATSDQPPSNSLSPAHRPTSSSSESSGSSAESSSSMGRVSSGDQPSKKSPLRVRMTPLSLRKSAPVVQRSKAEAQGVGGDRNSLCRDSAYVLLVESRALLQEKSGSAEEINTRKSTTPEPEMTMKDPLPSVPLKPHPPASPEPASKAKKPMLPPNTVLLPNKPALLGQTSHKRPRPPHTTRQRRVVPLLKPPNKALEDPEKFVIDMSSGEPVVSLPLVLLQQGQPPPSPPPATFFPSMLKPTAGSGVRSSVLTRQEKMIDEMIRSGGASRSRQMAADRKKPGSSHSESESTEGEGGPDSARKVPLLPPAKRTVTAPTHPKPTTP